MTLSVWNAPLLALIRPQATLGELKHKAYWALWPFFLLIVVQSSLWWQYYHHIDLNWFFTQGATTSAQAEQAGQMAELLSPAMLALSSAGALLVGQLLIFAIAACYLHLMTRNEASANDQEAPPQSLENAEADLDDTALSGFDADSQGAKSGLSFSRWFGFCCWISLPIVIATLVMSIKIGFSDSPRLPLDELDPFTLNQLLQLPPEHGWFSFSQSITLVQLWTLVLAIIGVQRWTGLATGASAVICLLPYGAIYGGWALVNALF